MTLKTSFIVGIAVAALVVGVQTASGQSPSDASDRASVAVAPDWFERAALAKQRELGLESSYLDAHGRVTPDTRAMAQSSTPPPDWSERWFERAVAAAQRRGGSVTDSHNRVDFPGTPLPGPTVTSGRELEWPQIGIGFGVGLVLAFGLVLALRATRVRPLAH